MTRGRDGKVHLRLVADPASGHGRLELARPVFRETWQNQLLLATANTAYAVLRQEATAETLASLARQAMKSTSTLVSGLLEHAPPGSVACRAGCAHCCHQSVGVTPLELLAIAGHLTKTRSHAELEALRTRATELLELTQGLSSSERLSSQLPCPLLTNGKCSVYEVRPLSCRGMNSLDARICAEKLEPGPTRDAFLQGTLEGHFFVEPLRAFHAISAGLQLALSECFRLDMRPLDLTAALALVLSAKDDRHGSTLDEADLNEADLNEVDGATSPLIDWLKGKPSLQKARGGDASDQDERWRLAGVAR